MFMTIERTLLADGQFCFKSSTCRSTACKLCSATYVNSCRRHWRRFHRLGQTVMNKQNNLELKTSDTVQCA